VDTTKTITHISLCAGYGGIDLGLKRAIPSLRTIAFSEIESFACANLVSKMEKGFLDSAPIWTDLKRFPWSEFRDRVDILSGGYPCQPFSSAGKRAGKEDPRHLWPWIADGIRILRPKVCFFENVEGHISLGLSSVISDLEELGYQVSWGIFSAREVGAPHQRKRVFILAHSADERHEWSSIIRSPSASEAVERCGAWSWPSRPSEPQHGWEPPRVVGNAESANGKSITGDHRGQQGSLGEQEQVQLGGGDCGALRESNWQAQPPLGGNPDGTSDWMDYAELYTTCDNRTDELRLLGNGVVPATAERAFRTLLTELLSNKQP
jgi:site-specific DNA-cytosine methylase